MIKYIFIIILVSFCIFSIILSLISICSKSKNDNTYIKNGDLKHFIYWSMISHISETTLFIEDEDDFNLYIKSYLSEKIKDDLDLDPEFSKIISNYPIFSLYEYISKVLNEDLGFQDEIHKRFLQIQKENEKDDNIIEELEEEKQYEFTDITKNLFDFTK